MGFGGQAFVARFNEVWNGHDGEGILGTAPRNFLALTDGQITATRSYRQGRR